MLSSLYNLISAPSKRNHFLGHSPVSWVFWTKSFPDQRRNVQFWWIVRNSLPSWLTCFPFLWWSQKERQEDRSKDNKYTHTCLQERSVSDGPSEDGQHLCATVSLASPVCFRFMAPALPKEESVGTDFIPEVLGLVIAPTLIVSDESVLGGKWAHEAE